MSETDPQRWQRVKEIFEGALEKHGAERQAFLDRVQGTVTLDLAGLEYISSAGLGVLLKTHKRLSAAGGKLRLAGASRHLLDIFRYSGFDQIFEIVPSK